MAFRMPFGKHKGQDIEAVPTKILEHYLEWDQLRDDTKREIESELTRRRGGGPSHPAGPATVMPQSVRDTATAIIAEGAAKLMTRVDPFEPGAGASADLVKRAQRLLEGWVRSAP